MHNEFSRGHVAPGSNTPNLGPQRELCPSKYHDPFIFNNPGNPINLRRSVPSPCGDELPDELFLTIPNYHIQNHCDRTHFHNLATPYYFDNYERPYQTRCKDNVTPYRNQTVAVSRKDDSSSSHTLLCKPEIDVTPVHSIDTSASNSIGILITTDNSNPVYYTNIDPIFVPASAPPPQTYCQYFQPKQSIFYPIHNRALEHKHVPKDTARRFRTELKVDLRKDREKRSSKRKSLDPESLSEAQTDQQESEITPVQAVLYRGPRDSYPEKDGFKTTSPSPYSEMDDQPCPTTSSDKNLPSNSQTEFHDSLEDSHENVQRCTSLCREENQHTFVSNLCVVEEKQNTPSSVYSTLGANTGSCNWSSKEAAQFESRVNSAAANQDNMEMVKQMSFHNRNKYHSVEMYPDGGLNSCASTIGTAKATGDQPSTATIVSPTTRKTSRGTQFEVMRQARVVRDIQIQTVPCSTDEMGVNLEKTSEFNPNQIALPKLDCQAEYTPSNQSILIGISKTSTCDKTEQSFNTQPVIRYEVSSTGSPIQTTKSPSTLFIVPPDKPEVDASTTTNTTAAHVLIGFSKSLQPSDSELNPDASRTRWDDTSYTRTIYQVIQAPPSHPRKFETLTEVQPTKPEQLKTANFGQTYVMTQHYAKVSPPAPTEQTHLVKEETTFSIMQREEVVVIDETATPDLAPTKIPIAVSRDYAFPGRGSTGTPKQDAEHETERCTCCQYVNCNSPCSTCMQSCDCDCSHSYTTSQVGDRFKPRGEVHACFEKEHICAVCNTSCSRESQLRCSCSTCGSASETESVDLTGKQRTGNMNMTPVDRMHTKKHNTSSHSVSGVAVKLESQDEVDMLQRRKSHGSQTLPQASKELKKASGLETLIKLATDKEKRTSLQRWLIEQVAYSSKSNTRMTKVNIQRTAGENTPTAPRNDNYSDGKEDSDSDCSCSECQREVSEGEPRLLVNGSLEHGEKDDIDFSEKRNFRQRIPSTNSPVEVLKAPTINRENERRPTTLKATSEERRPVGLKMDKDTPKQTPKRKPISRVVTKASVVRKSGAASANMQSLKSTPQTSSNVTNKSFLNTARRPLTSGTGDTPPRLTSAGRTDSGLIPPKRSLLTPGRQSTALYNRGKSEESLQVERLFELNQYDDLVKSHLNNADRRIKAVSLKNGCDIQITGPIMDPNVGKAVGINRDKVTYYCKISAPTEERIWKCVNFLKETFPSSSLRTALKP